KYWLPARSIAFELVRFDTGQRVCERVGKRLGLTLGSIARRADTQRPPGRVIRLPCVCDLVRDQALASARVGLVVASAEKDVAADRERAGAESARRDVSLGMIVNPDVVEVGLERCFEWDAHRRWQRPAASAVGGSDLDGRIWADVTLCDIAV